MIDEGFYKGKQEWEVPTVYWLWVLEHPNEAPKALYDRVNTRKDQLTRVLRRFTKKYLNHCFKEYDQWSLCQSTQVVPVPTTPFSEKVLTVPSPLNGIKPPVTPTKAISGSDLFLSQ